MDALEKRTSALQPSLVPVPPRGSGVCWTCHGPSAAGYCDSCARQRERVAKPLRGLVPITLYWKSSETEYGAFYDHLKRYKNHPVSDSMGIDLAALVVRFMRDHRECLEQKFGPWDSIVTVPSSSLGKRDGTHPLAALIRRTSMGTQLGEPCLTATGVHHETRRASDELFRTTRSVVDERILLLDDTCVSGAKIQSAASRLSLDGAKVVCGMVIGRQVNPEYNDESKALFERLSAEPFDFGTCCVEA